MKHKKALLLGLMSLFLAGGVATTFAALNYKGATQDLKDKADQAIYLQWGKENVIDNVTELKAGVPQIRDVVLDSKKSATAVSNGVDVTFTFAAKDVNSCLNGLNVELHKKTTAWLDQATVADGEKVGDINGGNLTIKDTVAFTETTAVCYYRLVISYDGTAAEPEKGIAGTMTVSLGQAA